MDFQLSFLVHPSVLSPNFTSLTNIKGKKQHIMEKYKKQKIKYHSLAIFVYVIKIILFLELLFCSLSTLC
jgi:hypothetical protein